MSPANAIVIGCAGGVVVVLVDVDVVGAEVDEAEDGAADTAGLLEPASGDPDEHAATSATATAAVQVPPRIERAYFVVRPEPCLPVT